MYNYFPHPSSLRTMDNVLAMRISEGAAGYGVYMMILELLRDAENHQLKNNPAHIAFAINEPDKDMVGRVINDYALFEVTDSGTFGSSWLQSAMDAYNAVKNAAVEAGKRGAAKRWGKNQQNQEPRQTAENVTIDPNSPHMGGGNSNQSNPNTNISIIGNKQDKSTTSKSKLLGLSWGVLGGEDLFRISREDSPMVDDAVVASMEQISDSSHNLGCVARCCKAMHVSQSVMDFIVDWSENGRVGSQNLMRVIKLSKYLEKGDFRPKYPNDYVLTRLLSNDPID